MTEEFYADEKTLVHALREQLEAIGAGVTVFNQDLKARGGSKGWYDLVATFKGYTLFVEAKMPDRKKLRPSQQKVCDRTAPHVGEHLDQVIACRVSDVGFWIQKVLGRESDGRKREGRHGGEGDNELDG